MSAVPEVGFNVHAAGLNTNYHDVGSGPPVLLLHGSGPGVSAWANWRTVIPALATQYRVLAPDIPGFGYTEVPPRPYDVARWAEHLEAFLDAAGVAEVAVVGNSFGGALALNLAARAPQRVHRLVLMGSAGTKFALTPGLDAVWGYEPSLPAMDNLIDVFVHDRSILPADLAERRYEATLREGVQESYAAMFPAPRQERLDALALPDATLGGIDQPTLVLHGGDDKVIPVEASMNLLARMPNAQLHIFGRCGHWVQIEQGPAFCDLVLRFLAGALDGPQISQERKVDALR